MKFKIACLFLILFLSVSYLFATDTDFTLSDLNGNKVVLSDFRGKNILLFFWAIYCPHCTEYLTKLENIYSELESKDIVLLSINIYENTDRIRKFIEAKKITYPILLDSNRKAAFQFNLVGIPTFIFIDKQGQIISQMNYLTDDFLKIFEAKDSVNRKR